MSAPRSRSRRRCSDGVAELIPEIRLEVLLDEGTRLVVLREPFGAGEPGVRFGEGDVPLVPDRERRTVTVTNTGERPIRISSHFPFWDANPQPRRSIASRRGASVWTCRRATRCVGRRVRRARSRSSRSEATRDA